VRGRAVRGEKKKGRAGKVDVQGALTEAGEEGQRRERRPEMEHVVGDKRCERR
jgi:Mg-chelatase subunit ChlD